MKFPNIDEIATREVVSIEERASLGEAIERMVGADKRDVIVIGERGGFGILTVNDVIRLRTERADLTTPLTEIHFPSVPQAARGTNLLDVFQYFAGEEGYLCVTDEGGRLTGILSYTDIIASIDPQALIERQRVGDILLRNAIKHAPLTATIGEVFGLLSSVGDAVVLCDGEERPYGILTTKDAIRLIRGQIDFAAPARDHVTTPLETVTRDITVREAIDYIREHRFKRIVVRDEEGRLLGMIHQRELIDIAYSKWSEMLRDQADELRTLVGVLERRASNLEKLAHTDRLTGAFNRGKFERALAEEISRCQRYATSPFSVAIMDLDHFKAVNDRHGHLTGDEVLKEFTAIIKGHIRDVDLFARWGGEEFTLLLPGTDRAGAELLTNRLCDAVAGHHFPGAGQVTVSIGVAEHRPEEQPEPLLHRADIALYRAKSEGRNRVEVAE
ncbi:diguanylate cyclase [Endothiovibrio diazotrophicus]